MKIDEQEERIKEQKLYKEMIVAQRAAEKRKRIILVLLSVVASVFFLAVVIVQAYSMLHGSSAVEVMATWMNEENLLSPVEITEQKKEKPVKMKTPEPTPQPTETIYSFLQGPKSWGSRLQWSGEWGVTYYDGGSFGGFGCGLCCMANVYSSLTPYQCTPIDAYQYAKEQTGYGGGGAIAWEYMKTALTAMGMKTECKNKPGSYADFQKSIAGGQAAIVLVSSNNSKVYWENTPGHYVTIFLYDEKKDKVFLADSGNPEHNRQWVALEKIYESLKTGSAYQYMLINGYRKEDDQWKHKTAKGNWVK